MSLTTGSFSIISWATAGSVVFVIGTLLLALALAPVFFDLSPLRGLVVPLAAVGVLLSLLSYWLMSPGLITLWVAVPALLTLAVGSLYAWPRTARIVSNKAVFLLALSIIIFSLQSLVYPKAIGQALAIDTITTTGAMADAFLSITLVGGILLALMLALYVRIAARGPSGPDL